MKPQPTFCVSVKLWLHLDMRVWGPSFWTHRTLRVDIWGGGGIWKFSKKRQGSLELIWATKGPSINA